MRGILGGSCGRLLRQSALASCLQFVQTARGKPCAPSRPCGRYDGGLAPAHTFSSQREQRETATPRHVPPMLPPGMPLHPQAPAPTSCPVPYPWSPPRRLAMVPMSPPHRNGPVPPGTGLISEALCHMPNKELIVSIQFPQNLEQVTGSSIPAAQGQAEPTEKHPGHCPRMPAFPPAMNVAGANKPVRMSDTP